jgi:hypothetical protein
VQTFPTFVSVVPGTVGDRSPGISIVQAGRLRMDEPNCEPTPAAIGNQYNELARILLSVHNPGHPTVGPLRRRFVQEADVS